jgi:hypothetical protein
MLFTPKNVIQDHFLGPGPREVSNVRIRFRQKKGSDSTRQISNAGLKIIFQLKVKGTVSRKSWQDEGMRH